MTPNDRPQIPEDTYEELMEATYRALCEHGYTNLRVRDIDEKFAKSRQLINHYYEGKDDLIAAVLEYLLTEFETEMDFSGDAGPEEQLETYIDQFLYGPDIDGFDQLGLMTALIELRSQAQHHPEHRDFLKRNRRRIVDILKEIIEEGIEEEVFREVNVERTANTISDIIGASQERLICLGEQTAPEEARAAIHELVLPQLRSPPE